MSEPTWINLRVTQAFHDRQINEHGGLPGLRDEGLLLSALSRPENAYHWSDPKPDVAELAAAYGFGLAKNHPFNDANRLDHRVEHGLSVHMAHTDLHIFIHIRNSDDINVLKQ